MGRAALARAALWLAWHLEETQTGIRAPWTGVTLAAGAAAFLAAGWLGRGRRAVGASALAGAVAVAVLLVPDRDCDPECASPARSLVLGAAAAAVLAGVGALARRARAR
jgi:hypothetical protein